MPAPEIIRCPNCGANNRVAPDRIAHGEAPVCGRCKSPLPLHTGPQVITDATFPSLVESSTLPVLVDMWAPWCGPCRMIAPIIDQLATEMAGQVRFAKLNTDENPQTAARFHIDSIPALLIFKSGREVDRIVGVHPKAVIAERLTQVIAGKV